MSTRRKPSDVLDPPSDPIWLPLIDALEKYAWPRGPVSDDFVDNEHRRHFQSLCAVRRLHPSEPLHDDVRWLWDAGVADFLRQLEEGQLESEGSPRIPYSDKIKIPADTWLAVRRTPLIDIDWGRSIVFPKLSDGALYGVRVAPATTKGEPASPSTTAAEPKCREWLVSLMTKGGPAKPKADFAQEARQLFGVGTRAFTRAWHAAPRQGMRLGPNPVGSGNRDGVSIRQSNRTPIQG
jgi:hypothetical protein